MTAADSRPSVHAHLLNTIGILPIYYAYFVGELIAEGPSRNNGKTAVDWPLWLGSTIERAKKKPGILLGCRALTEVKIYGSWKTVRVPPRRVYS